MKPREPFTGSPAALAIGIVMVFCFGLSLVILWNLRTDPIAGLLIVLLVMAALMLIGDVVRQIRKK